MEKYFGIAIKEAKKAYKKNEIPVGAVIVRDNVIIAKSHNNRQKKHNILGHAEINCVIKTNKKIKDWRLNSCYMYVTLEPCEMCKIILKESRIEKVFYLINQEKNNKNSINCIQTNDCVSLKSEYEKLLNNFFVKLRRKKSKK